jgi:solute carrier family 8 (sodium/calcium exchanger)
VNDNGLQIETLITDRHPQITKWVREEMKSTKHRYDLWHVAKGFKKKIDALSKNKDCEIVAQWSRSMINHLYWSVTSSNGNTQEIKEKWLSLQRHIHDQHTGHGNIYMKCSHQKLKRKWFKYGNYLITHLHSCTS